MHHEEMIQKIEHTVNNVNDLGLELIIRFIDGMEKIEKYNIHTSKNRMDHIRAEEKNEEAERKTMEENNMMAELSPFKLNPTMQMLGNQKVIPILNQAQKELNDIFKARPKTVTFETAIDVFMLGYIYGKRAERKRRKGVHHGR